MTRVEPEEFRAKLSTWLLYGVAAGLLPILFVFVMRWSDGQSIRPNAFLSSGDLILISVVLTTGALGDLLLSQEGRKWSVFARSMVFAACLVLGVGSLLYGRIASRSLEGIANELSANGHTASAEELLTRYDAYHHGVMWQSLAVFAFSLVVGIFMVRLRSLEGAR